MLLFSIPIIGSILEFLAGNIIELAGGIGALLMTCLAWLAKKYLVPLLKTEQRRRYAEFIAAIADEVTDELRQKYPGKSWAVYIDEAVDKIIEVCKIDPEIARRAAMAAISRK